MVAMILEKIDYNIFMLNVRSHMHNNFERPGQAYMNSLYELAPKHYAIIEQTPADCFYDDSKIHLLLEKLSWSFVF